MEFQFCLVLHLEIYSRQFVHVALELWKNTKIGNASLEFKLLEVTAEFGS